MFEKDPIDDNWSAELLMLAAQEAAASDHETILPVHLLIAVCRFVDAVHAADAERTQAQQRRLKREIGALGLDPQSFRRRMRAIVPKGTNVQAADILGRTLSRYVHEFGRLPDLASGAACTELARGAIARSKLLAASGEEYGARHLLRALLLGDSGIPLGTAEPPADGPSPGPPADDIPNRL